MPAFVKKGKKLEKISQKEFRNELELHQLIDSNLEEIFKIRYLADEHITEKHGRIETLGIDESNRPVVIEYKKTKDKGQLVQANRYITWIRQNPDSFELMVSKNLGDIGSIDFNNPRTICLAQEYNIDDKCLALSLGAELWKYRFYENGMLMIMREEEPEQLIKGTKGKPTIEKIGREPQPARTVEEHLENAPAELVKLFNLLNDRIMEISSEVERYTTKAEIIYKTSLNFAYLAIQNKKNCIRFLIRTEDDKIEDPRKITSKIPKTHGYGNITREMSISPKKIASKEYTIEDVMKLIEQSYNTTQ